MTSTMRFDKWENPTATKSVTMDQIAGGSGLVPITPTSVSVDSGSASIAADGTVTYSGANTIRVSGAFSAAYTNYKIFQSVTPNGGDAAQLRFRDINGDVSAANYSYVEGSLYSTTIAVASFSGATNTRIGYNDAGYKQHREIEVFNPYAAEPTTFRSIQNRNTGSSSQMQDNGGNYHAWTSFTGFTYLASAGVLVTGTFKIYGYR